MSSNLNKDDKLPGCIMDGLDIYIYSMANLMEADLFGNYIGILMSFMSLACDLLYCLQ